MNVQPTNDIQFLGKLYIEDETLELYEKMLLDGESLLNGPWLETDPGKLIEAFNKETKKCYESDTLLDTMFDETQKNFDEAQNTIIKRIHNILNHSLMRFNVEIVQVQKSAQVPKYIQYVQVARYWLNVLDSPYQDFEKKPNLLKRSLTKLKIIKHSPANGEKEISHSPCWKECFKQIKRYNRIFTTDFVSWKIRNEKRITLSWKKELWKRRCVEFSGYLDQPNSEIFSLLNWLLVVERPELSGFKSVHTIRDLLKDKNLDTAFQRYQMVEKITYFTTNLVIIPRSINTVLKLKGKKVKKNFAKFEEEQKQSLMRQKQLLMRSVDSSHLGTPREEASSIFLTPRDDESSSFSTPLDNSDLTADTLGSIGSRIFREQEVEDSIFKKIPPIKDQEEILEKMKHLDLQESFLSQERKRKLSDPVPLNTQESLHQGRKRKLSDSVHPRNRRNEDQKYHNPKLIESNLTRTRKKRHRSQNISSLQKSVHLKKQPRKMLPRIHPVTGMPSHEHQLMNEHLSIPFYYPHYEKQSENDWMKGRKKKSVEKKKACKN